MADQNAHGWLVIGQPVGAGLGYSLQAQIPLGLSRHIRRVKLMHFGCVELVKQHDSTRSSQHARHVEHVEARLAK